jgi:pimeloyl-ACP methyl ester carboxylesterase
LAGQYPVVAIDAIGWGESDHPARDYRVDDYLAMLSEVIGVLRTDPHLHASDPDFLRDPSRDPSRDPETPKTLNGNGQVAAERPLIVVASSLMGAIAVRWAIAHPAQVQGLILSCPSGLADFGVDYGRGPAAALARVPGVDRLLYGVGAANEVAVRSFLEQVLLGQRDRLAPQTVAAYLASALKPNADYAALASLRGDLCFDLAGYMAALTTPTVLLWGTAARFSSVAVGRRLAQLNPAVVRGFYEVPTAGVLPQLELPSVVTRILLHVLSANVLGIGKP